MSSNETSESEARYVPKITDVHLFWWRRLLDGTVWRVDLRPEVLGARATLQSFAATAHARARHLRLDVSIRKLEGTVYLVRAGLALEYARGEQLERFIQRAVPVEPVQMDGPSVDPEDPRKAAVKARKKAADLAFRRAQDWRLGRMPTSSIPDSWWRLLFSGPLWRVDAMNLGVWLSPPSFRALCYRKAAEMNLEVKVLAGEEWGIWHVIAPEFSSGRPVLQEMAKPDIPKPPGADDVPEFLRRRQPVVVAEPDAAAVAALQALWPVPGDAAQYPNSGVH